jgi:hypothetical protein
MLKKNPNGIGDKKKSTLVKRQKSLMRNTMREPVVTALHAEYLFPFRTRLENPTPLFLWMRSDLAIVAS